MIPNPRARPRAAARGRPLLPGAALSAVLLGAALLLGAAAPVPVAPTTIVFLRHAEKAAAGLGQLDCQGLNRALALPPVLMRLFGRPKAIFAPDPGQDKHDGGGVYSYVRPLATIEPTAIALGLPVDTTIGLDGPARLLSALRAPDLAGATVFVAWEHHRIVPLARSLLQQGGGDPASVPDWPNADYDSLYVLRIGAAGTTFSHLHEGLDGQSTLCPLPRPVAPG